MHLKEGRFNFASQFEDGVHHGRKGLVAEAGVNWSHCIHSQETDNSSSHLPFIVPFDNYMTSLGK